MQTYRTPEYTFMPQWGKLMTTKHQRSGTTLTNMHVHYIIDSWSLPIVPF